MQNSLNCHRWTSHSQPFDHMNHRIWWSISVCVQVFGDVIHRGSQKKFNVITCMCFIRREDRQYTTSAFLWVSPKSMVFHANNWRNIYGLKKYHTGWVGLSKGSPSSRSPIRLPANGAALWDGKSHLKHTWMVQHYFALKRRLSHHCYKVSSATVYVTTDSKVTQNIDLSYTHTHKQYLSWTTTSDRIYVKSD